MFEGLMPALVTPFDEDGEIDLQATEAVVERHIEAGVDGISALGSTGEFSHLTGSERRRFAEALVGMVDGRVPLVVGVGTTGTREAVDLARHAESVGADGVLSVSPFYWKVGEEALFRHFVTVAETVEIPTLVYNFPMLTGIDLSPALVGRLAAECPSIVGIKDTVQGVLKFLRSGCRSMRCLSATGKRRASIGGRSANRPSSRSDVRALWRTLPGLSCHH